MVLATQLGGTAARGHTLSPVYATMRDLAKGERLLERLGGCCPDTLEVLQLDVTDPCSLAAAAQRVQGQCLDVLGMALPGGPSVPGVAEGTSLGVTALPRAPGADSKSWEVQAVLGLEQDVFSRAEGQEMDLGVPRAHQQGKAPHFCLLALSGVWGYSDWLTALCPADCTMPGSLQCRGGTDGTAGDLLRPGHENSLRCEPLWGCPHHPGIPACHEEPQGWADHCLQQHWGAARWDPQHPVVQGAVGKSSGAQGVALPQGCPSMLCTVPASLQWRGCARVWPSSCAPSTSSECR